MIPRTLLRQSLPKRPRSLPLQPGRLKPWQHEPKRNFSSTRPLRDQFKRPSKWLLLGINKPSPALPPPRPGRWGILLCLLLFCPQMGTLPIYQHKGRSMRLCLDSSQYPPPRASFCPTASSSSRGSLAPSLRRSSCGVCYISPDLATFIQDAIQKGI